MILIVVGVLMIIAFLYFDKSFIKDFHMYKHVCLVYFTFVILNYILLSSFNFIKEIINSSPSSTYNIIIVVVLSMAISLITSAIFVYLLQRRYERKIIGKLENNNNTKSYEYYREILKDISPGILYCCNNSKIDTNDLIIAILLDLKIRKIIKIEDKKITVLNETENLLNYEKLILNYINKKTNIKEFKSKLNELLLSEARKQKYVYNIDEYRINITYFLEIISGFLIIFILIAIPIIDIVSSFTIFLFIAYIIIFLCIPIYKYIQSKINTKIRTKKGLDIAAKLNGLKNFIKDFSNISNNGLDNVNYFDEYVIYAIIFNMPGNLNAETLKLYKDLLN